MNLTRSVALSAMAVALGATALFAQANVEGAIKARHAHMSLFAHNLGILGGMARGEAEYDAEAASAAASNLHALASMSQATYWPEGSDNSVEGSRALPVIWENMDDFNAKADNLEQAAAAMQEAAGTDLAALQGAMGPLGGACGSCHETYRQPMN